jgi:dihydrofolate synthase/folylpolyglutamate synthase
VNSGQPLTDQALSLDHWLSYIQEVHPVGWDLGLDRVSEVGRRLKVLHPAVTTVLVAGTNGKGSTCEYLERFAMANGLSVGKSTSPHIHQFNERIAIDGVPVPDQSIVRAFQEIESARKEITLTYFEFATLASLLLVCEQKVDVAILEVGLGGRLDAMNIVDPDLTIITHISLDHQDWLGNTRAEIAREKAGIMRAGVSCIVADRDPPESVYEYALEIGASLYIIGRDFESLEDIDTVLPRDSFDAAQQASKMLGWDVSGSQEIGVTTRLTGRRTVIKDKCEVLLDVAHNPAAAASLAEHLRAHWDGRDIHAVIGMYKDKDIESVSGILMPLFKTCHLTNLDEPRGEDADRILGRLSVKPAGNVETYVNIEDALDGARKEASPADLILVCGSFPVVSGVLQLLSQTALTKN